MKSLPIAVLMLLLLSACENRNSPQTPQKEKLEAQLSEQPDSILKKQLEQLGLKDQTLRFLLPDVAKRFGSGSKEEQYFWTLIRQQDSINERETIQILEEHGWLSKSRIGEDANQALWLVIQHAPLEIQETYLPLLRKSVAEGESEGWHLAFLEDRILMRNDKKQLYGSQANWDHDLGKMKIHPIEDVKNVDQRRAELGLEPMKEYVEVNGYVFDQDQ